MADPTLKMYIKASSSFGDDELGVITIELYPDIAPISVSNFLKLAKSGFYNGTVFHRVIRDFVIQGGDPTGTGAGGPGWSIKGEFAANGVKNDLKHTRGVLSMARAMDYDSAGSQFFIMHADAPHLDGEYAAFGKVTDGMDAVDAVVDAYYAGMTAFIQKIEVSE